MIAPSDSVLTFLRSCNPADFDLFLEKMNLLGDYLYDTNESFNLTAIKPEGFWSKHVADSLSLAFAMPEFFQERNRRICDLGCGAGFPSLVLAAAFPHSSFTPVDSTRKKVDYVNSAAEKLGLKNLNAIHARGNELGHKVPHQHAYDAVTARAVASAEILMRESFGLLNRSGILIVYRTPPQFEEELPGLQKDKKIRFRTTETFPLPEDAGSRLFLSIAKA